MNNFTLNKSIEIKADSKRVWEALTNPELIKIYFFGTDCKTDWKKESPIIFSGVWENKPYEDKGHILDIEVEKYIVYDYWSSFSGTEDIPENYATIRYEIFTDGNKTMFTVIQAGFKNQEALDHSATNWGFILDGLKKVAEE